MGESFQGRGSVTNPVGRFEAFETERIDDGWWQEEEAHRLPTIVSPVQSRTIISRNDSPDIPFDQSINPYQGCEHGCSYCFARPSHAYLNLSPGIDFETRIFAKTNAVELLRKELSRKGYICSPIALGTNTDPYQPVERTRKITRDILELLWECRHPLTIVTKSGLVLRDLDLLTKLAEKNLVRVCISITTLRADLARNMEPRAASPERRLDTLRALSLRGIPCGVLASPMIPALNDVELEVILEASSRAGASFANYILVRLALELKEIFSAWLDAHYPDRKEHVLNLIRNSREGALHQNEFGTRMRGTGPYADLLQKRFELAQRRFELDREIPPLDLIQFRPPKRPTSQLSFFNDQGNAE